MCAKRSGSALLVVIVLLSAVLLLTTRIWFKVACVVDAVTLCKRNEINTQIAMSVAQWGVAVYKEYHELIDARIENGLTCSWHIDRWPQRHSEAYSADVFFTSDKGAIRCTAHLFSLNNPSMTITCLLRIVLQPGSQRKLLHTSHWEIYPLVAS